LTDHPVFLRTLEYYQGILILTSNRVGTFDEAFRSRIQIALHYPDLNAKSRRQIWQNFLTPLHETGTDEENDDMVNEFTQHLDELADHNMNGREIRNALATARQLALYKRQPLAWEHFDHALKTVGEFGKYLENVHGHTDKQWAREEKLR
jgi:hypothetical protein